MRRLRKLDPPRVLVDFGAEWTQNYINASAETRRSQEKWRHREIKIRLREETDAKCAYCEGYVEDVSYPHVEHIVPKNYAPALAHEWDNLTSACEQCNTRKGSYFVESLSLLNPYDDEINVRLAPAGAWMDWTKGDSRAELTVMKLGLNRIDLVTSRARRLDHVRALIERWHSSEAPVRAILADVIQEDALSGEFRETVMAMLASHGFPIQSVESTSHERA
ncbi:HNH endonuclease [Clavibacter sp. B3I6]|uniref:HNH endonuclease n=1 Tax=Clavibacter sp. B3I6 TaxID=3042268 RepID=UPI00358F5665